MLIPSEFPIQHFINTCPPEMGELLNELEKFQDSKPLRSRLDSLISLLRCCDGSKEQYPESLYLQDLQTRCYQLARFITDNPRVTMEDLLIIYAKRRIDPSYLPGHLIGQEPPHIPTIYYTAKSKDIREVLGPRREKNERKRHKRIKQEAQEKQIAEKKLLTLTPRYRNSEFMPKKAISLRGRKLLGRSDLPIFWSELKQSIISTLDNIKLSPPNTASGLQKVLLNRLTKLEKQANTILRKPPPEVDVELTRLPRIIEGTSNALLGIIREFETLELQPLKELKSLKEKIKGIAGISKDESGKIGPRELADCRLFERENADQFRKNPHLDVKYLNEEEREQYRVHIYQGKCYRICDEEGNLQIKPFCSEGAYSHEKQDWFSLIMNDSGDFFVWSHIPDGVIMHSSFTGGKPVLFAGEIKTGKDGTVRAVTRYSGHYRTDFEYLTWIANHLNQRKVDVSGCFFYGLDIAKIKFEEDRFRSARFNWMTKEEKQECKSEIDKGVENLKYSRLYCFENNQLIEITNYKTILMITAFILATIACGLILGAVIYVTKGGVIPVIAPIIAKMATYISVPVAHGLSITIPALLTGLYLDLSLKFTNAYDYLSTCFLEVKSFYMNLVQPNSPEPVSPTKPVASVIKRSFPQSFESQRGTETITAYSYQDPVHQTPAQIDREAARFAYQLGGRP